jgi:SPP1 family phage portal protein
LSSASLNGNKPITVKPFATGYIPLIEYPLNNSRLGLFEIVLPILNSINTVQSNRLDGIEQFIQSLTVLYNADIDKEEVATLRESGFIKIKNYGDQKADIKEISQQLDQQQTQTLIDYMYQTVLNIVGMPNRNGGTSTSDTGSAVELRDGWSSAETRAKQDETMFKLSEMSFLKIILRIMRDTVGTNLKLSDIDTKFTRRNYENIQSKAQVLCQMLRNEKIHPQLAFTHSGMFSDPEAAYLLSKKYYDTAKKEAAAKENIVKPKAKAETGGGE